ncbi:MAG: hypothetical protein ACK4RK_21245, partial [Gemmataceae bacterium]
MDAHLRHLIEAFHHTGMKCVLALAGGGTTAAAHLLGVPGGSRTILEIVVPYHERALSEWLGHHPEQACSLATSQRMAQRAYERACWLVPGNNAVGVGCTASLATDRPKRGEHRFHISVQTSLQRVDYSLILCKGTRDRLAEEAVVDAVLLNALAEVAGLAERVPLALMPEELLEVAGVPEAGGLAAFYRGELPALRVTGDGQFHQDADLPPLLLPGSFNPVHAGHWGLAAVAQRLTGLPVAFELSVTNVDKAPLLPAEVQRRLRAFTWKAPVWLTRAPTFMEKATLFPGALFVVGADTASRIVIPKYYEDSAARMRAALEHIRAQGCRFLVAGRVNAQGKFSGLEQLAIPSEYKDLFTAIAEADFRLDISSTELRAGGGGGGAEQRGYFLFLGWEEGD